MQYLSGDWLTSAPMFTAAFFTVAAIWKQSRCPLTDEWVKKMWYLRTMEYYSALKKEILQYVTTQMNLRETGHFLICFTGKPEFLDPSNLDP